jgi:hypothetical protein
MIRAKDTFVRRCFKGEVKCMISCLVIYPESDCRCLR